MLADNITGKVQGQQFQCDTGYWLGILIMAIYDE